MMLNLQLHVCRLLGMLSSWVFRGSSNWRRYIVLCNDYRVNVLSIINCIVTLGSSTDVGHGQDKPY